MTETDILCSENKLFQYEYQDTKKILSEKWKRLFLVALCHFFKIVSAVQKE